MSQLIKSKVYGNIHKHSLIVGGITGVYGAQITGNIIGTSDVVGIIVAFIKNSKREK